MYPLAECRVVGPPSLLGWERWGLGVFLIAGAVLSLPAQTLYWDVNSTTAGAGGASPSGGWRTNNASYQNWNTMADGTGATGVWTADAVAVFSAGGDATGSYTVTVNSVSADSILIERGNILFNSSSITLTGVTPSITVSSGATATFSTRISGTDFVKAGEGTLIFQGTSKNYSGTTHVTAGTLQLGASGMIDNSSDLNISSGATLDLNGYADTVGSLLGAGTLSLGSATLTLDGDGATTEFSGSITGSGNIAKTGTDTLILSGSSTYTGTTTVSTGILNVRHSNALGSTDGGTTVASGRQLQLEGGIAIGAEALSLTGTGVSNTGALRNMEGDNTYGGAISLTGITLINTEAGSLELSGSVAVSRNLTLTGAGDTTISGALTGSSSLVKTGTGTLTLSGANTHSGTITIGSSGGASGGTLRSGAANVLSDTSLTLYAGLLDLNGHNDTIGALNLGGGAAGTTAVVTTGTGTLTLTGNLTYTATNNPNGASLSGNLALGNTTRTFTINDSSAVADDVVISAAISGTGGLTKQGNGTLVLSGNNTYTGLTSVSAGVLNIRHANALGTTDAGTVVTSGDQLQIQGNIHVGAEALSLAGSGVGGSGGALSNVSGDNTFAGVVTLTNTTQINSEAGSLTLSAGITGTNRNLTLDGAGDLYIGNITTGSGTLTKNGTGTLVMSGNNTYTGDTNVNAGTLRLGISHALSDSTDVIVAAGATFDVNGMTDSIASLAGAGDVTIGSGSLSIVGNASTLFSGTITGDGLLYKGGTGTLTLTASIDFDGTFELAAGTLRLNGADMVAQIGTLKLMGNTTIDFASNATLSVDTLDLNGFDLTILNWTNASDYFFAANWIGAVPDSTGSAPMSQIAFTGFTSPNTTKWQSYDDQVTPVPEPSTYGALLLGALAGFFGWRRSVRRPAR